MTKPKTTTPSLLCRSGDCNDMADYEIIVRDWDSRARMQEGRVWQGSFCHKHLQRVLPARLQMLMRNETMMVTKLRGK